MSVWHEIAQFGGLTIRRASWWSDDPTIQQSKLSDPRSEDTKIFRLDESTLHDWYGSKIAIFDDFVFDDVCSDFLIIFQIGFTTFLLIFVLLKDVYLIIWNVFYISVLCDTIVYRTTSLIHFSRKVAFLSSYCTYHNTLSTHTYSSLYFFLFWVIVDQKSLLFYFVCVFIFSCVFFFFFFRNLMEYCETLFLVNFSSFKIWLCIFLVFLIYVEIFLHIHNRVNAGLIWILQRIYELFVFCIVFENFVVSLTRTKVRANWSA